MDGRMPIAQLQTIRLDLLQDSPRIESAKLFDACLTDGIFYLDICGTTPNHQGIIDEIFTLESGLFNLSEEQLMEYDIDAISPKRSNGYKPLGRNRGGFAGEKDGFQSYALPKNGVMQLGMKSDFVRPPIVDQYLPTLRAFACMISKTSAAIFSALSVSLGFQSSDDLRSVHTTHKTTPDIIRLLKYHTQPISTHSYSHIPHTDMGSLTFLFTKQFGLQVLGPKSNEWQWVKPREGCAIVNVGDCLSFLTNRLLHSCTHRVCPFPGQESYERYSFAYLMRPDEDALMKPVRRPMVPSSEAGDEERETLTCGEWMKRKYAVLRGDTWKQEKDWILTGAGGGYSAIP